MRLPFWTVLIFACSAGIASAEPSSGTIIGNISKDILNYECRPIDRTAERISCDFVQVLLSKKSKPTDFAENLGELEELFDAENIVEAQAQICQMSQILDAVVAGNVEATFETMERADLVRSVESYKTSAPKVQDDMNRLASYAREFCNNPTRETGIMLFRNMHEKETRTCTNFVNKYTQTYVKISDTLWAVESTPSGPCEVVNTSKFIGSEEYGFLWEHETSKVIMNKEGEGLLKCADLDESRTLYSWRDGPYYLGCDYIE